MHVWWENLKLVLTTGRMYPRAARIGFLPKDKAVIVLGESRYLTGRPIILLRKKWLGLIKSAEVSLTPKVNLAAGEGYEETSPEKTSIGELMRMLGLRTLTEKSPCLDS